MIYQLDPTMRQSFLLWKTLRIFFLIRFHSAFINLNCPELCASLSKNVQHSESMIREHNLDVSICEDGDLVSIVRYYPAGCEGRVDASARAAVLGEEGCNILGLLVEMLVLVIKYE